MATGSSTEQRSPKVAGFHAKTRMAARQRIATNLRRPITRVILAFERGVNLALRYATVFRYRLDRIHSGEAPGEVGVESLAEGPFICSRNRLPDDQGNLALDGLPFLQITKQSQCRPAKKFLVKLRQLPS